ncbi:MAG TPA: transcription antitermination factor NusB [Gemmatimonadales bacterium]|jgi:N utilization substance protein B
MAVRKPETRSRALALQLLYAWDLPGATSGTPEATWARVLAMVGPTPRVEERGLELASGVVKGQPRLDASIERAAERWRIERLGIIDRNVLRLGTLEIETDAAPIRVVIDEAVRLARWFGGEKSPSFVNGVLDRIARDLGKL